MGSNQSIKADKLKRHLARKLVASGRLQLGWQDCEYGAPEVDPKRPYGNSSVEDDIREILGLPFLDDDECREIHELTLDVLREMLTIEGLRDLAEAAKRLYT